jgi:acyl phosphate:glycerol-3-phosphate acyltransferase
MPEQVLTFAGLAAGGYLLGSVPVSWLITIAHTQRDLRMLGSGNVGVMNTAISVHRWAGLLVFLGEIAKGVTAVALAAFSVGSDVAVGVSATAAFVGTRWPVWLRFRGGRGNTTAVASLLIIAPLAVVLLTSLWLVVRRLGTSSFVATRVILAASPPVLGLVTLSWWWALVGAAYALLFLTTHDRSTDDHLLLRRHYPSVLAFLTAPRRRGQHVLLRRRRG